ncbi:MAG: alkaline phosphatase family protein [Bacillota bacterium]|nr:alkaline phosphatase family protein [Bacillota bacterium]MDW7678104.1 alkaline phosphatase family protein [Bacillota bacterium]
MKTILLMLDGLGDRPQKELEWKTPLEAALTPNLDTLCRMAETGMLIPWRQGVPLGTEAAHFVMLGYDMDDFPDRGVIHALSMGEALEEDMVYLVTTWAWVEATTTEYRIIERNVAHLTPAESDKLAEALPREIDGYAFTWKLGKSPHGVLKIHKNGISGSISDSDPFYPDRSVMEVLPFETDDPEAASSARALNRYLNTMYDRLVQHPVNQQRREKGLQPATMLLTKWCGMKPPIEPFHIRNGMSSLLLGQSTLMEGIAALLRMKYQSYESVAEAVDTALKAEADYVHIHTKRTDDAAHTKNPLNKVRVLEEIDEELGRLVHAAGSREHLIIVTGDHTTPSCGELIHAGDSVPILFCGSPVRPDAVEAFGERSCATGSLRITGSDLMPMILNYTERAIFYNFRPGSVRRLYIQTEVPLLNPTISP